MIYPERMYTSVHVSILWKIIMESDQVKSDQVLSSDAITNSLFVMFCSGPRVWQRTEVLSMIKKWRKGSILVIFSVSESKENYNTQVYLFCGKHYDALKLCCSRVPLTNVCIIIVGTQV